AFHERNATGLKAQTQAPLRRIFNNKHRCNTIVLSLAWILVWMGIQTFSVLGTTILESREGVDASSALMIVVVANIVGAVGYITPDRPIRCNHVFPAWVLRRCLPRHGLDVHCFDEPARCRHRRRVRCRSCNAGRAKSRYGLDVSARSSV